MSDLPDQLLPRRLRSWAQNEVMIDHYYTAHGRDCHQAADEIERLRAEIERLRKIEEPSDAPTS